MDQQKYQELISMMHYEKAVKFITESNHIEGINRAPSDKEIAAHQEFLQLESIEIKDLTKFVSIYQPNAKLREKSGVDVFIGNHTPISGGSAVVGELTIILAQANATRGIKKEAHYVHCLYEQLHPYTDGNGRSGRMLWLWMMHNNAPLGFLHTFYYSTLDAFRK